ncbi:unnamed protein product [Penicillium roqueforti FM164]|uniref:Genomic scaffold, ProqFM164S02 n=1 Tax=Penicillium roqueforti (strain FM164) TaxID=1365484 RepID=W6QML3_PENRF|nr:unnamed protein product [Penicillium roqueforti FM164]
MGPPVSWHAIGSSAFPSWTGLSSHWLTFMFRQAPYKSTYSVQSTLLSPSTAVNRWRGIQ